MEVQKHWASLTSLTMKVVMTHTTMALDKIQVSAPLQMPSISISPPCGSGIRFSLLVGPSWCSLRKYHGPWVCTRCPGPAAWDRIRLLCFHVCSVCSLITFLNHPSSQCPAWLLRVPAGDPRRQCDTQHPPTLHSVLPTQPSAGYPPALGLMPS